MIRLSRILNLNFPSRLSQTEIDALPTIKFQMKPDSSSSSSIHLIEKCPICLTEFYDQEIINKLHCTHLFHRSCISTWLSVSSLSKIWTKKMQSLFKTFRKTTLVQRVVEKWTQNRKDPVNFIDSYEHRFEFLFLIQQSQWEKKNKFILSITHLALAVPVRVETLVKKKLLFDRFSSWKQISIELFRSK